MACTGVCGHSAIEIVTNPLGFRYPKIDTEKCTDCGLCRRVCPQLNRREYVEPRECYAAAIKPDSELLTCASGGAATALAVATIRRGGLVVGCSGEDMHRVRHIAVESIEELSRLKGSKYVQSEISAELLRQIRRELTAGREVLFIGTGCQTAGVRNFLMKPYENLTTVDLVCHGVPSQQMLDDNIALYPEIDANSIRFREKRPKANGASAIRFGWSQTTHSEASIFIPWYRDPYLAAFMDCISFRDGCYRCLYAQPKRQSDLTVADFWGLGKDSALINACGVSLILVNSSKGAQRLKDATDLMVLEKRTVEEAVAGNGQLQRPSEENERRQKFIELYLKSGFMSAVIATSFRPMLKKHLRQTYYYPMRTRISRMMPKNVKTFIKRILNR